jgi:dynein heavy chain
MVNNMMIEGSAKSLDPQSLFQGDPDEGLKKLNMSIEILELHNGAFKEYRDSLPEFLQFAEEGKNPIMWTFTAKDIFERFDHYMNRLYTIRDIFYTANEFWKLEKVDFEGIKGRVLSKQLIEIHDQFQTVYMMWNGIQFDPLDSDPKIKLFEEQRLKFMEQSDMMERKIATILSQAFDECYTIESLVKLIQVAGSSLLSRRLIYPEIVEKLVKIIDLYNEALELVKQNFDEGLDIYQKNGVIEMKVDKGFPPVAGTNYWIRKLRSRINRPTDDIPNLDLP